MRLFLVKLAAAAAFASPWVPRIAVAQAEGATGLRVPAHERFVLDNGITVIVLPRHDVPLVAFDAVLRGGALGDPAARPGAAAVLAGLLEKGAGPRDAYAFADAVEGAGGSFHASAGTESLAVTGQFLARDRELMLELLADALQRPRLDAAEFDKLRARQAELIKAAKDSDPSELLGLYGRAFLFGSHPYGRPVSGSEASLARLTLEDVRAYYAAHVGADRLTLIFSGDIDPEWVRAVAPRTFGAWRRAGAPAPVVAAAPRATQRRVLLVDSPGSQQTYFWVGNVGVGKRYPQRAALDLANTLLGGRFTSMLNTALRIESGLSYGARSSFVRSSRPGEFAITSFTQTENMSRALDITLDALARLRRRAITADALDSARAYVLGQYPLQFETATDWAGAMAELALYGLGTDYIESYGPALAGVGLADVERVVADAFPTPDAVTIVLIGDAARIRDAARRYGAVTELALSAPVFAPEPGASLDPKPVPHPRASRH